LRYAGAEQDAQLERSQINLTPKLISRAPNQPLQDPSSVKLTPLKHAAESHRSTTRDMVLVAADTPPMFDRHSGALRLFNIIRIITELGWQVVFSSPRCGRDRFVDISGSSEACRYEASLLKLGIKKIVYGAEETDHLLREVGAYLSWAYMYFP